MKAVPLPKPPTKRPRAPLPEMTLPAPAADPPIVNEPPSPLVLTTTPSDELGIAAVPAALVPTRFPRMTLGPVVLAEIDGQADVPVPGNQVAVGGCRAADRDAVRDAK